MRESYDSEPLMLLHVSLRISRSIRSGPGVRQDWLYTGPERHLDFGNGQMRSTPACEKIVVKAKRLKWTSRRAIR